MQAGTGPGMTQTLLIVVLFVAALCALPWLIRRLQARQVGLLPGGAGAASRVLSAVAVGPQQRVVTVEVGPAHQRAVLVLGVTAQQINCLHVLPAAGFAGEVAAARQAQEVGDAPAR
ncbi:flagellar protein FliO/FliZ [Oryzisolibacter propanilivorax]|uniref:Flagellar protein FliO/FliZ n=2 Tax=Oryzisolibacter propanilivorax TaxID=1527607 RepID=A0A1G9V3G1_9BURK|nr:flagellar protein FliO/FliZ [Oryzisolibacter propanilivorax]